MSVATVTYDNLFSGDYDVQPLAVTIVSGSGALARGTVLGIITASGKYTKVQSDGTDDGRRVARAVLADSIDATSGDVLTVAYFSGCFNESALVFGGTDTISTHRTAMAEKQLFARKNVSTAGTY